MMNLILRIIGAAMFILLMCAASCPPSPQDVVTIPAADSTPPSAGLDAHFTQPGKVYITVTNSSSPASTKILGNEEVSLAAKGSDNDGGCRDIQIWIETTAWRDNPDGTRTKIGPGLIGAPEASNPDPGAGNPGDQARKERLLTHKLDIRQIRGSYNAISLKVWATALNFHGGEVSTATVTLEWP